MVLPDPLSLLKSLKHSNGRIIPMFAEKLFQFLVELGCMFHKRIALVAYAGNCPTENRWGIEMIDQPGGCSYQWSNIYWGFNTSTGDTSFQRSL